MKTIKEIEQHLQRQDEPTSWMNELKEDPRVGVQKALARWQRRYDKKEIETKAHMSKITFDESFAPFKGALIAGVDEAGRGPLAGPVVCAAVVLPGKVSELIGLDDSKAITKEKREQLAEIIKRVAITYSIHVQSAAKIDELNIYAATRDSMERAVQTLSIQPDFVLVDAMELKTDCPTASIVKADAKSLAVAAASILAKTERDALMDILHKEFPVYNFVKNAGYGTKEHVAAIHTYGPSEHHRRSFEPIKSLLMEKGDG